MKKLFSSLLVCCLFTFHFAFAQVPSYVPTNGLVGWWPFNGNANDESGNGNHGTVNGATLSSDRLGNIRSAYYFNGSSSFISIPYRNILSSNSGTVALWIRVNGSFNSSQQLFFGQYEGRPSLYANSSLRCAGNLRKPGASWRTTDLVNDYANCCGYTYLDDGIWHQLVTTFTDSSISIYVDGILEREEITTLQQKQSIFNDFYIGGFGSNAGNFQFFNGVIDDVAFYNRALNLSEIRSLYSTFSRSACTLNILNGDTTICQGKSITLNSVISETISDIDGNVYPTVNIGNQTWTQKNLNVSRYRNGQPIQNVTNSEQWINLSSGAWCWYNNDSTNSSKYGKLYNWFTIFNPNGLAPLGWRVPNNDDWNQLITELGGNQEAGGKMKSQDSILWGSPNFIGSNSSGFSGLPGGFRGGSSFYNNGVQADFWSSNESRIGNTSNSWYYLLYNTLDAIGSSGNMEKVNGLSIRLIKDGYQENTYSWSTGATTPSITVTPTQSTTYYLTATSGNTTCRDSVRVTVVNIPTNFFAQDSIGVCGSTYTVSAPSGMNSYSWSTGATTRNIIVTQSGWYRCTITTGNCSSIDSVYVYLMQSQIINNDTSICTGQSIVLNGVFGTNSTPSSMVDIDGNVYPTIRIGSQTWMAKNLNVSRYRNGDPITHAIDNNTWINAWSNSGNAGPGAWCWPRNNQNYGAIYGKLYNYYSLTDSRNIAPPGWHAPTETEWITLFVNSGGYSNAGARLKEIGETNWLFPNQYYSGNPNGFNALPAGNRGNDAGFNEMFNKGFYWTMSIEYPNQAIAYYMHNESWSVHRSVGNNSSGLSVRLVMDEISNVWSTGATTPSITVTPTQSTTYYLTATSGNTTCRDSVRVTVVNIPTNFFAQDTIGVCGTNQTLSAPSGMSSYVWSSGANTRNITVTQSGWYRCTIASGNCSSSDSVYVNLVNANIVNGDTTICSSTSVTLIANSSISYSSLSNNFRNGLVGYWPFNGNANDESGNGNHGQVFGPVLSSDRNGTLNSAYYFNGLGDYIRLSQSTVNSSWDEFTISAWIQFEKNFNTGQKIIFYNAAAEYGLITRDDLIAFQIKSPNNWESVYKYDSSFHNKWTNIVGVFKKGRGLYLYKNGLLLDSISIGYFLPFNYSAENRIGNYGGNSNGTNYSFSGKIDDLAVFNRALNTQEIYSIYSNSSLLWSTGATTPSITVTPTQSTTYYLTATSGNTTCRDSVRVTVNAINKNVFPQDTIRTCGTSYALVAGATFNSYSWNTGDAAPSIIVRNSGWYRCTVRSGICTATDSVYIEFIRANIINRDTTVCLGSSVVLRGEGFGSYLWSTGATTPSITVTPNVSSTYYLNITSGNTTCRDSVRVIITNFNANPIAQDTINTCNLAYTIIPAAGYTRYTWSNGTVTPNNTVRASGWYKLTVLIGNCSATDSVYIKMLSANILNRDTTICQGQSVTLNASQGGSGFSTNLRNGLVGYWPFNGNANDESGNGNHGVVNGATLTADRFGNSGKAYGFDGVNDYINCGSNQILGTTNSTSLTISSWVYVDSNTNGNILSKYFNLDASKSNYILNINNKTVLFAGNGTNSITSNSFLSNQWNHVVAIIEAENNNSKIYLNNSLISSGTLNINSNIPNTSFNIGRVEGPLPGYLKGTIDEIAIYNRALSPSEVTQLYQSTGSGNLLWSTGATTPSITVTPSTSTTYFLTVSEGNVACQDTVRVNVTPFVQNPILADTVYACGRSTSITAQSGCIRYNWSNGAVTPSTTVNTSGWYYLTAISSSCTAYDSVYVQFVNANILNNDTSICLGQSVTLNAEQGGSGLASNLRNGLVGYWPFNGNANDESGNGNHGILNGSPTLITNRFGTNNSAYQFASNADYISGTANSLSNQIFSISLWINNLDAWGGTTMNCFKYGGSAQSVTDGGYRIYSDPSTSFGLQLCVANPPGTGSNNHANQQWHHVVGVYDGSLIRLYVDGALTATQSISSININFSNNKFFIGNNGNLNNGLLSRRQFDDIAIYNRALSPSEVTQLYQSTGSGNLLWSTGATTPSMTVTPTANTTYYLTASQGNVSCRDSVRVNVTNISLGMPGTISGNTDACASIASDSAYRYTIRKVLGATSYQWTAPSGATLVSGQGDTTVLIKFGSSYVSGGQISVAARSQCNQLSQARTLSVTRPVLQTPVGIQQSFTPSVAAVYSVCGLNSAIYRIRKVTGATGYVWTLRRGFNASIVSLNGTGVNDTAIQINFQNGFVFDTISVRAISGCAQSAARTLVLNTNYTPAKIQAITTQGGNFVACIGQPMTLTAIPATPLSYQSALSRYSWTLPTGAFVVSASSSDSATITINFNSNFRGGSVSVRGRSACTNTFCGTTSAILKYYPPTPLSIVSGTGSYNACVGDQVTYTVLVPSPSSSQTQAVRFRWTLPLSTIIVSATADSSSVTVRFLNNFNGGRLSVRGITDCGTLGSNYGQLLSHNGCAPGTKLPVTSRRSEQTKQSFTAKLYPNPTAADFRVQMERMNTMPVVIKTMDVQGRLISSKQYQPATIISMETPKSAGTYWIEIRQGESVVVLKGIKI